jgi:hypothetical protein
MMAFNKVYRAMHHKLFQFYLLVVLLAVNSYGAVLSVCSVGCTQRTINQAITAASCGDKIRISSSETHYGGDENQTFNNPIILRYKNCPSGNPIVITTDREGNLPAAGTRITPNYADGAVRIIPKIVNPAYGALLTADVGSQAAHDYTLVGLEFCCSAWGFSFFIGLGDTILGSSDTAMNAISDLPSNITFDRILVRADPLLNMRECLTADGISVVLQNSWIECGFDKNASDSQGVAAFHPQHLKVLNNYISGTTETVGISGGCSPIRTPKFPGYCSSALSGAIPVDIEVAFNEVTKPAWMRILSWSGGTWVPRGQSLRSPSGIAFQALNSGVTGIFQPQWPSADSATVQDGQVTWQVVPTFIAGKNLLESKANDTLNIHHNFFHEAWPQGQQGYAFTFTSRTNAGAGGGNWAYIKNITLQNNVIANAGSAINTSGSDGDNDPNASASIMPSNAAPYNITAANNTLLISISGGPAQRIVLTTGPARQAQDIVNDLNAQLTSGLACLEDDRFVIRASNEGPGACAYELNAAAATLSSVQFLRVANQAYDVLGFVPCVTYGPCINPRNAVWYGCGSFIGLSIRNNLWANLNVAPNLAGVPYVFGLFNKLQNVDVSHNTVDAANPGVMISVASQSMPLNNVTIRNNLFGSRTDNAYAINGYGTLYDFTAINYLLCNIPVTNLIGPSDTLCPAGIVTANLMPGIRTGSFATLDTRPFYNDSGIGSYPAGNWGDTWSSVSFQDPANLNYTLSAGSKFAGAATDGTDVGVDSSQLPLIRNLAVTATNRQATLSFQLTQPIASIPCVVRVSPDQDFATVIPDLDPSQYAQPDSSASAGNTTNGTQHNMVVGKNAALNPGTTYYYHLACGGASRYGSFQTFF